MVESLTARPERYITLDEMRALVGRETGISDWLEIGQDRIDAFADLCGDHQFIHVDPARAVEAGMPGTIAHGFLTLSLLSWLAAGARPRLAGTRHSVNYGFDRIRFTGPVPSGGRVRARFALAALDEARVGEAALSWDVTVEVEGAARPALVARWLTRSYLEV